MNIPFPLLESISEEPKSEINSYYIQFFFNQYQDLAKQMIKNPYLEGNNNKLQENVFTWMQGLSKCDLLKICSLNAKWLTDIYHQLVAINYSFRNIRFSLVGKETNDTDNNTCEFETKKPNNNIKDNNISLISTYFSFKEKDKMVNISKKLSEKELLEKKFLDNIRYITVPINNISLNNEKSWKTMNNILCLSPSFLSDFTIFKNIFLDLTKKQCFSDPILITEQPNFDIKGGCFNFALPDWARNASQLSAAEFMCIYFEMNILINYQYFSKNGTLAEFTHYKGIEELFELNKQVLCYLNEITDRQAFEARIEFKKIYEEIKKDSEFISLLDRRSKIDFIIQNTIRRPAKLIPKKQTFINQINDTSLEMINTFRKSDFGFVEMLCFIEDRYLFTIRDFLCKKVYDIIVDMYKEKISMELTMNFEKEGSGNKNHKEKKKKKKKKKKKGNNQNDNENNDLSEKDILLEISTKEKEVPLLQETDEMNFINNENSEVDELLQYINEIDNKDNGNKKKKKKKNKTNNINSENTEKLNKNENNIENNIDNNIYTNKCDNNNPINLDTSVSTTISLTINDDNANILTNQERTIEKEIEKTKNNSSVNVKDKKKKGFFLYNTIKHPSKKQAASHQKSEQNSKNTTLQRNNTPSSIKTTPVINDFNCTTMNNISPLPLTKFPYYNNLYYKQCYMLMFFPPTFNYSFINESIIQTIEQIDKKNEQLISSKEAILNQIVSVIQSCLKNTLKIPHYKILYYGSYTTSLTVENSDIDIMLKLLKHPNNSIDTNSNFISNTITSLVKEISSPNCNIYPPLIVINPIYTASVPVLKLESSSNIKFDITFFEYNSISTLEKETPSELIIPYIKQQLAIYPHIRPIILILKKYFQHIKLNSSYKGGLSSYSLFLLVYGFVKTFPNNKSNGNIGYLFSEFLFFYANFNFYEYAIDVRQSNTFIIRENKMKYIKDNENVYGKLNSPIVIMDPLTGLNVAKNSFKLEEIQRAFHNAIEHILKFHDIEKVNIINSLLNICK